MTQTPKILPFIILLVLICTSLPAAATTYYVSTAGSDAYNGLAKVYNPITGDGPWQTIGHGDASGDVAAGDTVKVQPGTYAGFALSNGAGTASQPITYKADSINLWDVIIDTPNTGCWINAGAVYTIIDGFKMINGVYGVSDLAPNVTVRNCWFDNQHSTGANPIACVTSVPNFTAHNNLVTNNRNVPPAGNDPACFVAYAGAINCHIYNNTMLDSTTGVAAGENQGLDIQNNIICGMSFTAMRWCQGKNNIYWNNLRDYDIGQPYGEGEFNADPMLDDSYKLQFGSPAIDRGINLSLPYFGTAPDLGAFESRFTAPGWGFVEGVLTNSATGSPLAGATVKDSGGTSATADSSGHYLLLLSSGAHSVTASCLGYTPQTVSVTIPGGTGTTKNFPLNEVPTYDVDRLGTLKTLPIPCKVNITSEKGVTVSSLNTYFGGNSYIEEIDRSCGIKVAPGSRTIPGNRRLTLSGTLDYDENGELCIYASSIATRIASCPDPVGMKLELAAGTTGMSVKTWGKMTYRSPDGSFIYIDDGSKLDDGTGVAKGIRVILNGTTCGGLGTYNIVKGVTGLARVGGITIPVIRCIGNASSNYAKVDSASSPIVLHNSITGQWGGHTFGYLIEGENGFFWSGKYCDPNPSVTTYLTVLVGQYPKPGSSMVPRTTAIPCTVPGAGRADQPQMIRTPDGYIHIFTDYYDGSSLNLMGHLRYYRSAAPEDITTLVDRTANIPQPTLFHVRMGVAISPDGTKMAWSILSNSNQPLIFRGTYSPTTHDFTFANPVQYSDPIGLFYDLVNITNDGQVVIAGENWNDSDYPHGTLFHLDSNNNVLARFDLPLTGPGNHCFYDMKPLYGNDRTKLALYSAYWPKDGSTVFSHQFWLYDLNTRQLTLLHKVNTTESYANPGKMYFFPSGASVFINNPMMGRLHAWEGDILGTGSVTNRPVPGCDPIGDLGYKGNYYVMAPNVLHGSVLPTGNDLYYVTDCLNPDPYTHFEQPCSLLLWHLRGTTNFR